jgi:hypothetical protein
MKEEDPQARIDRNTGSRETINAYIAGHPRPSCAALSRSQPVKESFPSRATNICDAAAVLQGSADGIPVKFEAQRLSAIVHGMIPLLREGGCCMVVLAVTAPGPQALL